MSTTSGDPRSDLQRLNSDTVPLGRFMVAQPYTDRIYGDGWTIRIKRGSCPLGAATWSRQWKRHVFQPDEITEFSADCLREIARFLSRLDRCR